MGQITGALRGQELPEPGSGPPGAENAPAQSAPPPGENAPARTLARGLEVLAVLCHAEHPMSVSAVAAAAGLHRSVTYRLLRTLELHGLALQTEHGYRPGIGLRRLVEAAEAPLQRNATPVLSGVVEDLGVTAFLAVAEGDLCVTRACVEARRQGANLVQRPGTAHPLTVGAPGLALLVTLGDTLPTEELAALAGPRMPAVAEARSRGWTFSHDEVIPSVRSVAVPVRGAVGWPAALAVVYLGEPFEPAVAARRLQRAAREFADAVRR